MYARSTILSSLATVMLSGALLVACGGSQSQVGHTPDDEDTGDGSDGTNGISAEAEIGALDQDKVADTFRDSLPGLQRCLLDGSKRVEFIGGNITFYVKINKQSEIAHIHAVDSTIGDRKTELCMFDVLKSVSWPAPQGGMYGIAKNPFEFDAPIDVRAPVSWNEGQLSPQLSELRGQMQSCKNGYSGRFTATLYIDTDGTPISGSVTPPDEGGEQAVDCLVGVLLSARYETPGSWPAKVTADL